MNGIVGKSVVILGAASPKNMGQIMARRFVEGGAKVLIAGRHESVLREYANEIGALWRLCDITIESDVNALVAHAVDRFGGVDVGINATGIGQTKPLLDITRADLEQISSAQWIGPFQYFQALLRAMKSKGKGSIVQISTVSATIVLDDCATYTATKAATDHLAIEDR